MAAPSVPFLLFNDCYFCPSKKIQIVIYCTDFVVINSINPTIVVSYIFFCHCGHLSARLGALTIIICVFVLECFSKKGNPWIKPRGFLTLKSVIMKTVLEKGKKCKYKY